MNATSGKNRTAVLLSDRIMFRKSFAKMLQVLAQGLDIQESSLKLASTIELPTADSGLIVLDAGACDEDSVLEQLLSILTLQAEASVIVVIDEQIDAAVNIAMDAGALGVAVKAAPPQVIIDMLQRGLGGERFRPAPVTTVAREDIPVQMRKQLSARQQKLLRLIIGGQSISATASELGITPGKVVAEMRTVLGIVRGRQF